MSGWDPSWGPYGGGCKGMGKGSVVSPPNQQQQPKAKALGGLLAGQSGPEGRTQVSPIRHAGQVVEWKNQFGWIQPDKPVPHPQAKLNSGRLFLSQGDVPAEDATVLGTRLTFLVYTDGARLGAQKVMLEDSKAVAESTPKGVVIPKGAKASAQATSTVAGAAPPVAATSKEKAIFAAARKGTRQRITYEPIAGEVFGWNGSMAKIRPLEPVQHAAFSGLIDCHKCDVNDSELPKAGAKVVFYVWATGNTLGAESCTVVMQAPEKPKVIEKPKAVVKAKATDKPKAAGAAASAAGKAVAAKPVGKVPPPKVSSAAFLVGAAKAKATAAAAVAAAKPATPKPATSKPATPKPATPPTPAKPVAAVKPAIAKPAAETKKAEPKKAESKEGPRTRITEIRTTGEVTTWSNNYGWIELHAPIDHPKAKKDGTIFVGRSDVIGRNSLMPGQLVQFHAYCDNAGLGAEECSLF